MFLAKHSAIEVTASGRLYAPDSYEQVCTDPETLGDLFHWIHSKLPGAGRGGGAALNATLWVNMCLRAGKSLYEPGETVWANWLKLVAPEGTVEDRVSAPKNPYVLPPGIADLGIPRTEEESRQERENFFEAWAKDVRDPCPGTLVPHYRERAMKLRMETLSQTKVGGRNQVAAFMMTNPTTVIPSCGGA